jgi:hypothetical protein
MNARPILLLPFLNALFLSPAASTSVDAKVVLGAPNPIYGETLVNVKGTHTASVVNLDSDDRNYTWDLYGTLSEKVFLISSEVNSCSSTGGIGAKPSLSCETVYSGACDHTYLAKSDAQIVYSLLEGAGPGDSDSTEASPICNVVSTYPHKPLTNSCQTSSCTPIVIDLDGAGFHFTDLVGGVPFDLDADGEVERTAWTAPSTRDAFLVLDRNDNGWIDDGSELFGGAAPQPVSGDPNGFAALRVLDQLAEGGNDDGFLSPADADFGRLKLWIDADHDGISQPSEIVSLAAEGIEALNLAPVVSERRDRYGNRSRWASQVLFQHGHRLAAVDVVFLVEP